MKVLTHVYACRSTALRIVRLQRVCLVLQTMLGRAGGLTVLQSKGDRYSVLPGDKLKFGTVETTVSYSTTYRQVAATTLACMQRHQKEAV